MTVDEAIAKLECLAETARQMVAIFPSQTVNVLALEMAIAALRAQR